MSTDDFERLISERSLVREPFDDSQVAGFWAKAVASYSDARVPNVSADGALQLVYTACLQATFAVLAARGLRVKSTASHYKAFYALQRLDVPVLREYAIRFDELRATRHASIYEPDDDEAEIEARCAEAIRMLGVALPEIHAWLAAERPDIVALITPTTAKDSNARRPR